MDFFVKFIMNNNSIKSKFKGEQGESGYRGTPGYAGKLHIFISCLKCATKWIE